MIVGVITVADCERVQTNWFLARATALGGSAWSDDQLQWIDGPDGLNLMFRPAITLAALRRGIERVRDPRRQIVGVWLGVDVDPTPLLAAGLEKGWSPWWMTG